ncbi:unnamed protein product [Arctogadus glacialis]
MALEQGRLAEFKSKTLDDISIDPEESEVTSSRREENKTAMPDVSDSDAAQQQGTTTPTQASHRQLPKRQSGRHPFKKRMWEKEEILAVEKHMMSFITSCHVPGKSDCDKCIQQEK